MGSAQVQGELWGANAEDWAFKAEPSASPLWRGILDAAEVGLGTKMLDMGCGAGGLSTLASERGADITGIDASEALLNIARSRIPAGSFQVADIEGLPFPGGEFDVVIACNSIQFANDQHKAASEARRMLKPNGKFAIGMWCEPERCEATAVFRAVGAIAPPPPPNPNEQPSLAMRENLVNLVESAGFKVIKEGEVECPFAFPSPEEASVAMSSSGMTTNLIRKMGKEAVRGAMLPAFEQFRQGDGSVRLSNWFRYLVCRP